MASFRIVPVRPRLLNLRRFRRRRTREIASNTGFRKWRHVCLFANVVLYKTAGSAVARMELMYLTPGSWRRVGGFTDSVDWLVTGLNARG